MIRSLSFRRALPIVGAAALVLVTAAPAFAAKPDTSSPAAQAASRKERGRGPLSDRDLIFGIDVSHWQGRIHWPSVARFGVRFAMIKATDGTWMVDNYYHRNRMRAQAQHIRVTAYHYARPDRSRGDAIREADWFLRHSQLLGRNLVPALDMEERGKLSPRELQRWVLTWLRRVESRLGVKPMVYTSPGFWSGWLGNSGRIAKAGYKVLWLAHYETRSPSIPGQRWNGHGWTFWQWTQCGHVEGIRGCVDRNYYLGDRIWDMSIRYNRIWASRAV